MDRGILANQNYMIKYFVNYECGSDPLMRRLSWFLTANTSVLVQIFLHATFRADTGFKRFLCFVLINDKHFRLPLKMYSRTLRCFRVPSGVLLHQVDDHCSRKSVNK
jgi:hypothetical protein